MSRTVLLKPARIALADQTILFQDMTLATVNPIVWTNARQMCSPQFVREMLAENRPKDRRFDSVIFGAYKSPVYLDTRQSYILALDDCVVEEQFAAWEGHYSAAYERIFDDGNFIPIDRPAVVVVRRGDSVWGHWLLEMLPKIVLTEKHFPGQFSYIIPGHIFSESPEQSYGKSVRESLAAYGIGKDRIIFIRLGEKYVFSQLFDVAGAYQRTGLHPAARQMMQSAVIRPEKMPPAGERIAILRRPDSRRSLANHEAIRGVLRKLGFTILDLLAAPFPEQVAAFAEAKIIVCELGSDLASIIYAANGTRIVTLGPADWFDTYFQPFLAEMNSYQADLRGPSTGRLSGPEDLPEIPANCSYTIDPGDLARAIQHLESEAWRDPRFQISGSAYAIGPRQLRPACLTIDFARGGNAKLFTLTGWAAPEQRHSWSLGVWSELSIPLTYVPRPAAWVEIRAIGLRAPGQKESREMTMHLNGEEIAALNLGASLHEFIVVDTQSLPATHNSLWLFTFVERASPKGLGLGNDARDLGIGMMSLSIYPAA